MRFDLLNNTYSHEDDVFIISYNESIDNSYLIMNMYMYMTRQFQDFNAFVSSMWLRAKLVAGTK